MSDDDETNETEMDEEGAEIEALPIEVLFLKCKNGHTFGTMNEPGEHKCPTCGDEQKLIGEEQILAVASTAKPLADALRAFLTVLDNEKAQASEMSGDYGAVYIGYTSEIAETARKALREYEEAMK